MHHGVGIGIFGIDAERLRKPDAVAGLDRGEAKALRLVARRDEADPARTNLSPYLLSSVSNATSIRTIAGPVLTSAPSGSIHRSGVRIAVPSM